MKKVWETQGRTLDKRAEDYLESRKIPFRRRIDVILFFGVLGVFILLAFLWGIGVLVGGRLGVFDRPAVQPIADDRILINIRDEIYEKPLLDAVQHLYDGRIYISQEGGSVHIYNPSTRLWSLEKPFSNTGLLNPDLTMLRSGSGADSLSTHAGECPDRESLWAVSAGAALVRRIDGEWQPVISDSVFPGSRDTPLQNQQLTAAAVSHDRKWLVVGTEEQGIGVYSVASRKWLPLQSRLFRALPSQTVTHIAWWQNLFWIGGPYGLVSLEINENQPEHPSCTISRSIVTGRIIDLDVDMKDRLWVVEKRYCRGGGGNCLRITRFQDPHQSPERLVDEADIYPYLNTADLHFAQFWGNRLMVTGQAGLFSYDPQMHSWERHFNAAVLSTLPLPEGNGFYFGSTGEIGIATKDQYQQWQLSDAAARIKKLRFGRKSQNEVLGLAESGKVFAITNGKAGKVFQGGRTLFEPANFNSAFAFGNTVLFIGKEGVLVHDIVTRTYRDIPADMLPDWLKNPDLQFLASGDTTYAASPKGSLTNIYQLPTSMVTAGNFKAAVPLAVLPGPVSRLRDYNGKGMVVIAGGDDGRVYRFGSKSERLTGTGLGRLYPGVFAPYTIRDVTPYKEGLVAATSGGLWHYSYRTRDWKEYHLPPGIMPREVANFKGQLLGVTDNGELFTADDKGRYTGLIGQQKGFDISDNELSDVRVFNANLYLAGNGKIFVYNPTQRRITDSWDLPGRGEVRLKGIIDELPLALCDSKATIGSSVIDPEAGPVLNLSVDNNYIWTVRADGGQKYLKRYPKNAPSSSPGECFFRRPGAGRGVTRILDAKQLTSSHSEAVAAATDKGLRFYSPAARSWYRSYPLTWIVPGDRIYKLGNHLVLTGRDGNRSGEFGITFANLDAIRIPAGTSGEPVTFEHKPPYVRVKSFTIDPQGQRAAFIDKDGRILEWKAGKQEEILAAPSNGPAPGHLRRVFNRYPGKDGFLLFTTDTGILRYNLAAHEWRQIRLNVSSLADINIEKEGKREIVIAGTTSGEFFLGRFDSSAKSAAVRDLQMRRIFTPSNGFNHSGDHLLDVQQRGGKNSRVWTFVLDDCIKYYNSQKRQWSEDVMIPGSAGSAGSHTFYKVGDRGVVIGKDKNGDLTWWVARQRGDHPRDFARYRHLPAQTATTALDTTGTIWRFTADGKLFKYPKPSRGDYPSGPAYLYEDNGKNASDPITRLFIGPGGQLLAQRSGTTEQLASFAAIQFDSGFLPGALDTDWLRWNRGQKSFAVSTPASKKTMTPKDFIKNQRLIFEEVNAILPSSDFKGTIFLAANRYGTWSHRRDDLSLMDRNITFRPLDWDAPTGAAHGCFISGGKLYNAAGQSLPPSRNRHGFTIGDVTFSEDITTRRVQAAIRTDGGAMDAFSSYGFKWDREKSGIFYGKKGVLLVQTEAGVHPVKGYRGFQGRLKPQRLLAGQSRSGEPGNPNRILIDNNTWKWEKRNGTVYIQLKAKSYNFKSLQGPRGYGFTSDQLVDAVADQNKLYVMSEAFFEVAEPSSQFGSFKASRFPAQSTTRLETIKDANGRDDVILFSRAGNFYWNPNLKRFQGVTSRNNPSRERLLAAIPAGQPRLRFRGRWQRPVKKEVRVQNVNGKDSWVPFRFVRDSFPFDIVTSIAAGKGRLYVGTAAGLQVYPDSLGMGLGNMDDVMVDLRGSGSAPLAAVTKVGRPLDKPDTIMVRSRSRCIEYNESSGSRTARPCGSPALLDKRLRLETDSWRFVDRNGTLVGRYKDEKGNLSPGRITLQRGRFPHDWLKDIAVFDRQIFTMWHSGWLTVHPKLSMELNKGMVNHNKQNTGPKRFIVIPRDIPPGLPGTSITDSLPRGLYFEGQAPGQPRRVFRYANGKWLEVRQEMVRIGILAYADRPPLIYRQHLALLSGANDFTFQRRGPDGTWFPVPWQDGRVVIDKWSDLFYVGNQLWAAAPVGLVTFSRAPDGQVVLDPDHLLVIREPGDKYNMDNLPEITDIAVENDVVTVRCEANSDMVYQGTLNLSSKLPPAARNPFEKGFLDLPKLFIIAINPLIKNFWKSRNLFIKRFLAAGGKSGGGFRGTFKQAVQKETGIFQLLDRDPFVEKELVSEKESGFWSWYLKGNKDRSPGWLEGTFHGEALRLVGGRFEFDTVNSLAFFQDNQVEIGTDAGGWYQAVDGNLDVGDFLRPRIPGIDYTAVKGVLLTREGDEPVLGLRTAVGDYIRLGRSTPLRRTKGCPEFLGDDGFWRYQGDEGKLVITTAFGKGGKAVRSIENSRFTDDIVIGLPITGVDEEGQVYYLIPTRAGVLAFDENLKPREIHAGPFPGLPPEGVPDVFFMAGPGMPLYAAQDGMRHLAGSRDLFPELPLQVPEGVELTAVEDGPQDFIRTRWKMAENEHRGWSLSRPKSGISVENTFLINVSGFGKYIRNREKWGYPQPWMQIRLRPNRIEFFRPDASTLHALDFQSPIDLLFPIVKAETLFLIGKRNLLEINLEHAMEKSFGGATD